MRRQQERRRNGEENEKEIERKWTENEKKTKRSKGDEAVQFGSTHPNVKTETECLITR